MFVLAPKCPVGRGFKNLVPVNILVQKLKSENVKCYVRFLTGIVGKFIFKEKKRGGVHILPWYILSFLGGEGDSRWFKL